MPANALPHKPGRWDRIADDFDRLSRRCDACVDDYDAFGRLVDRLIELEIEAGINAANTLTPAGVSIKDWRPIGKLLRKADHRITQKVGEPVTQLGNYMSAVRELQPVEELLPEFKIFRAMDALARIAIICWWWASEETVQLRSDDWRITPAMWDRWSALTMAAQRGEVPVSYGADALGRRADVAYRVALEWGAEERTRDAAPAPGRWMSAQEVPQDYFELLLHLHDEAKPIAISAFRTDGFRGDAAMPLLQDLQLRGLVEKVQTGQVTRYRLTSQGRVVCAQLRQIGPKKSGFGRK